MNDTRSPASPHAFEALYRSSPDPWHFATSPYEQRRYAATLESLQRTGYRTVFEPGCSIGALTARLATLGERVIATDIAPSAVLRAQERCKHFDNVTVRLATGLTELPDESVDLVVFSEIGYYFDVLTLEHFTSALADALDPGGEFIAVHWLGNSPTHTLHGDVVHETLMATLPLAWVQGSRHDGFRIDSWMRT